MEIVDKGEIIMADIFRIVDRFKITGRGYVYLVKPSPGAIIHVGDVLFDLKGNQFEVAGLERIRHMTLDIPIDERPVGICIKGEDHVVAQGTILVREQGDINFLFCNHPLYPKRVDEDYEQEYQAAGLHHSCGLFSYEDLEMGKLSLYGEGISGLTIYRGWMMKPELHQEDQIWSNKIPFESNLAKEIELLLFDM